MNIHVISTPACTTTVRKDLRLGVKKWSFTLGAICNWRIRTRSVSFKESPLILRKLRGNRRLGKFVTQFDHFFLKVGTFFIQVCTFFFDYGEFIFKKE